ncbi:hypothetical protein ACLOJK_019124 [Asimina triloba]
MFNDEVEHIVIFEADLNLMDCKVLIGNDDGGAAGVLSSTFQRVPAVNICRLLLLSHASNWMWAISIFVALLTRAVSLLPNMVLH